MVQNRNPYPIFSCSMHDPYCGLGYRGASFSSSLSSCFHAYSISPDRGWNRLEMRSPSLLRHSALKGRERIRISCSVVQPDDVDDEYGNGVPQTLKLPFFFQRMFVNNRPQKSNPGVFYDEISHLSFALQPSMGISFLDVNKQNRYGLIKEVHNDYVSVYILYTKDVLHEVQQNIKSPTRLIQIRDRMDDFHCLQSSYMDEVPMQDIQGIVSINCAQVSLKGISMKSLLIVGWLYFGLSERKSQECQVSFFKSFKLSADHLQNYFDVLNRHVHIVDSLYWELSKVRHSLHRWLQLRGKPKVRSLEAAKEAPLRFNVELADVNAILFLLKLCQAENQQASEIQCSYVSYSTLVTCSWIIPETSLKSSIVQRYLNIPFKECPFELAKSSGSLYVEGPLTISLKRYKSSPGSLMFKWAKILRHGWNGKEIWRFPPIT